MKKLIATSFLAVLALSMLLPEARQVNAGSTTQHSVLQGPPPPPPGGGGH